MSDHHTTDPVEATAADPTLPQRPQLKLKAREERRLRAGHPWIYSNEIDTRATPLKGLEPGALATLSQASGRPLATVSVNPAALICARVLGPPDLTVDEHLFELRLAQALSLRERLFDAPYYRLVHSEGDGLPGLIVDRYDDVLVVQVNTAGMEALQPLWLATLQSLLNPTGLLLLKDTPAREIEQCPADNEIIGVVPDTVEVPEGRLRFTAALATGQKTGWFFDQRRNRLAFAEMAAGQRVLDTFSYVGGWGLQAAAAGASSVTCVDSSQPALDALQLTATRHDLKVETRRSDVLEMLKSARDAGEQFDLIVLDPPALIKRRKDLDAGREHYARLNRLALELLPPGGILVSCSCSHHMPVAELQRLVQRESTRIRRPLQLIDSRGAGPDHPVHPALPESAYLKALSFRRIA